jgi:uncharacterized OsmC-like protein
MTQSAVATATPVATPAGTFKLAVERVDGYEFRIRFDKEALGELLVDEPPPLGKDRGPNPARLLAASVASCLSASLVFCLHKAGVEVGALTTEIETELVRNERRRLRIGKLAVRLRPELPPGRELGSCLEAFEDFCVVTESVRQGIEVDVAVVPNALESGT